MAGEQPNNANQPTPEGPARPGTSRVMTTGGAVPGTPTTTEPQAPKAQSEIGPTTYGAPGGPIAHGADDAVTKEAYALGHPAEGIAARAAKEQPGAAARLGTEVARGTFRPGQTNPEGTTPHPQGTTPPATQRSTANQAGAPQGGMQRVRMVRDEGGHTAGQEVTLPADEARGLTDSGAAQAI